MSKVTIGGQAVMEGVMMKNGPKYAVAVRKPDKEIEVKISSYTPPGDKAKILRAPLIRGVVNFVDSLTIGMKTLMYSAEFFEEEELSEKEKAKLDKMSEEEKKKKAKQDEKKEDAMMAGTVVFSIVLAIGLFMLLPAGIATLLEKIIDNNLIVSIIEGIVRIGIFLGYVALISMMEDIKRTFMYHGAEHKTINCLEHDLELTVENVMGQSRFHKRCGTSFLFIVMLVSIFVFMFINTEVVWLKFVLRVLLVPVIAGISYEFIKFAGRSESCVANTLSKPGLWLQKLTTKEPTPDMVEVAIKAVEGVLYDTK